MAEDVNVPVRGGALPAAGPEIIDALCFREGIGPRDGALSRVGPADSRGAVLDVSRVSDTPPAGFAMMLPSALALLVLACDSSASSGSWSSTSRSWSSRL